MTDKNGKQLEGKYFKVDYKKQTVMIKMEIN